MAVLLARRPLRWAGNQINPGEPVVGVNGETPTGRKQTVLLASGRVYVASDPGPVETPRRGPGRPRKES